MSGGCTPPIVALWLLLQMGISGPSQGLPAAPPQTPTVAQPAPPPVVPINPEKQRRAYDLYGEAMQEVDLDKKVGKLDKAVELYPFDPMIVQARDSARLLLADQKQKNAQAAAEQKAQEEAQQKANDSKADAETKLREAKVERASGQLDQAGKLLKEALPLAEASKDKTLLSSVRRELDDLDAQVASTKRMNTAMWALAGAAIAGLVALIVLWRKKKRTLVMVEGPEQGRIFKLEKELTTIGAVQADWVVEDPYRKLSRLHCQIARSGRHFFIVDCSRNGTFLNGRAIPKGEPILLRGNDEITLCDDVILIFR